MRARWLPLLFACLGCSGRGGPPEAEPPAKPAPVAAAVPRVVVVFVVDQLPSWALLKYLPVLDAGGVFRRGLAEGVFVDRVRYAYASTNTGPGHAAIFTGKPPADTGIIANEVIVATGVGNEVADRTIVDDGVHATLGREGAFASPAVLRVPGVADALKEATGGKARVVAVAGKDRAAILTSGKRPDLVIWYEHRARGYTTSTYYAEALPEKVRAWQDAHPVSALLVPWEAEDPAMLARVAGVDDAPGEGDWLGFGTTFPHDPRTSSAPYSVLRLASPHTEHMLELALVAADSAEVGADETTDLLIVSVSGTDYAGHTFGPDSWEYVDQLVRSDRAMGALVRRLEERGPVAVLVTSDHGGASLPEVDPLIDLRVYGDEVMAVATEAARAALGAGQQKDEEWVAGFAKPYLVLRPGLNEAQRKKAVAAIASALREKVPGIQAAYDVREAIGWRDATDDLRRSIGLSVAEGAPGDLYVLIEERAIFDEDDPRGKGTSHGTPWPRDREVPAVFFGPGVAAQRIGETLAQDRVAPTISALLGAPPPAGVTAAPLPGATQ
jgi:arylsulfatase A-like enzyme